MNSKAQTIVHNDDIEHALQNLKRKIKQSNLIPELKEKEYFIKSSAKRRNKKKLGILRAKYAQLKQEE